MVNQPNKLWVEVVRNKYCKNNPFLHLEKKIGSPFWAALCKTKKILKEGFTWLQEGPLCGKVDFVNIQDTNLKIRDVFRDNSWQLQHLASFIPKNIMHVVQRITWVLNDHVHDMVIWKGNLNGSYTAKSSYPWLLKNRFGDQLTYVWNWIWRLKASKKIKFLYWLLPHNSVLILQQLYHRGIAQSGNCLCCLRQEDTFLHYFRDCESPKHLWSRLGFLLDNLQLQKDPLIWLKEEAMGSRQAHFLTDIWSIWRSIQGTHFSLIISILPFTLLRWLLCASILIWSKSQGKHW